jgi:hypothetical protein
VVYACRQAGVDDDVIQNMKRLIKTRQLPQTKLKVLAEELGIQFEVSLWDGDKKIYKPKGEVRYTVKLYLIENHYLLNEKIPVSPYFRKHYEEIMNCKKLEKWTLAEKQLIIEYKKSEGLYKKYSNNPKKSSLKIKKVIGALQECGYLKPIHHGDYLTYASTLYQEKLEDLEKLDYDPSLCCRLKVEKKTFKMNFKHVFYADCESSTDGFHTEYNICFVRADGRC